MKILAGVHAPDAGEILIDGERRSFERPADALAAGIAMIYQELSLAPHLTVAENIFLGREPRAARLTGFAGSTGVDLRSRRSGCSTTTVSGSIRGSRSDG
jgi:ABC-type sugar transport system ATPase subunit